MSFKTDPDEKGTERSPTRHEAFRIVTVSRLIPMKRELKGCLDCPGSSG